MRFAVSLIIAVFSVASCPAQQSQPELSPRDLFYREQPSDTQKPPESTQGTNTSQTPAQNAQPPAPPATKAHHKSGSTPQRNSETGKSATISLAASDTPNSSVQRAAQKELISPADVLGLRYNIVLVDATTRNSKPADPDRVFQPGECIALEFEANSFGYLYVLEKGSSGAWIPLLPSAEMSDESNVLKARTVVRIPQNYCFEIGGPPGEERVFVALSRQAEDLNELHQSIKNSAIMTGSSELLAKNNLSEEMSRLQAGLHDRDLKLKKIDKPESAGEPANSVYVVNVSATSSDRVVAEIRIQHR
jgi:hypothetical protein